MSDFTYREGTPLTWAEMNENLRLMQAKYLDSANNAAIAIAAANFKGNWTGLTGALAVPASVYHASKFWLLLSSLPDVTAATPGVSASWLEIITGNVMGPASATDNALARFDLATGKILQNSTVTLSDAGGLAGVTSLNSGQLAGLRNKIINGNFDVWQRGASFTNANGYTADRWKCDGATSITFSRISRVVGDVGTYRMRVAATAATNGYTLLQAFEADVVNSLKGKTVTFSFYIDGSFTGSVLAGIQKSAPADASSTGFSTITIASFTPTGSPVRHSLTAVIPDDGTANGLRVFFTNSNMTNGTAYDLQGVQLEVGSVATPFEHRPYGMELALCQRYYFRTVLTSNSRLAIGQVANTTLSEMHTPLPVQMRAPPSALDQSGTAGNYFVVAGVTATACSVVPSLASGQSTPNLGVVLAPVASGLTAGQAVYLRSNASGFLGFSAEL